VNILIYFIKSLIVNLRPPVEEEKQMSNAKSYAIMAIAIPFLMSFSMKKMESEKLSSVHFQYI